MTMGFEEITIRNEKYLQWNVMKVLPIKTCWVQLNQQIEKFITSNAFKKKVSKTLKWKI